MCKTWVSISVTPASRLLPTELSSFKTFIHKLFVTTTHPQGRAGDIRGNKYCFYFCIIPAVCDIAKKKRQCYKNILLGNSAVVTVPAVWGFGQVFLDKKSKSLLFPGARAVVTID